MPDSDVSLSIVGSTVRVDGSPVDVAAGQSPQQAAMAWIVSEIARPQNRTVVVAIADNNEQLWLRVQPDGHVEQVPQPAAGLPSASSSASVSEVPRPAVAQQSPPRAVPRSSPFGSSPNPSQEQPDQVASTSKQPARHAISFLPEEHPHPRPASGAPASGWRRFWARFGMGAVDEGPTVEQLAEAADIDAVSQHWLGPRTIAVVNGKGGSNKTPTTALLAAVFARFGGGGVLAFDNNETRGTLGWRTQQSSHEATVRELLPHIEALMDTRASLSQIANYVHHQRADKYDVLRSNPDLLAVDQRLTTEEFLGVHGVAQRYFRLILIDSSNDESSYPYLNMLDAADQIVVSTTIEPDRTQAATQLMAQLFDRNDHGRRLVEKAMILVSNNDSDPQSVAEVAGIVDRFAEIHPRDQIATVPYDRAMRAVQLRYDNLQPATQRAFLRAGAVLAEQLRTAAGWS